MGVTSKTVGGGQTAHGEDDAATATGGVPEDIAVLWCQTFGELTDKQSKFLANAVKPGGHGPGMVRYAIEIAAGNIAAGTPVDAPASYVKGIITRRYAEGDRGPDAVTSLRPGEVDNEQQRRKYSL